MKWRRRESNLEKALMNAFIWMIFRFIGIEWRWLLIWWTILYYYRQPSNEWFSINLNQTHLFRGFPFEYLTKSRIEPSLSTTEIGFRIESRLYTQWSKGKWAQKSVFSLLRVPNSVEIFFLLDGNKNKWKTIETNGKKWKNENQNRQP